MENAPLLLMSFLVGALIGLTSMGGAALMAPFLILVLGVRPVTAVGTDLVYGAVTKIFAAFVHLRQDTVDMAVVKKLAIGSVPGGLLGSAFVFMLPGWTHDADRQVQRAIGVTLLLVALVIFVRMIRPPSADRPPRIGLAFLRNQGCVIWGAAVGFCVGLTSVGSGSLLAPFLLMLFPANTSKVVGTDIVHAAILVSATGLVHVAGGTVEWSLVPVLLAGSIPGVLLGSRLALRVPARLLRAGLALLLFTTASADDVGRGRAPRRARARSNMK